MAKQYSTRKKFIFKPLLTTANRVATTIKHQFNSPAIKHDSEKNIPINSEENIIEQAFTILTNRLRTTTISLASKAAVEKYLLHKLMLEEREIFGAIWMDVKNRVIECEELALGTLKTSRIYPREIIKSALKKNAASVIFFHNHPSGDAIPSPADKELTEHLKTTLESFDINVLDHFIIAGIKTFSFAEAGEL